MAEVTAELNVSNKWNIGMTTANGSYSCTYEMPDNRSEATGDTEDGSFTTWIYSEPKFKWTFSPGGGTSTSQSGSNHFTGLGDASKDSVEGSVVITCTETITVKTWWTEEWNEPYEKEVVDDKGNVTTEWVDNWKKETYYDTQITKNEEFSIGSASAKEDVYTRTDLSSDAFYFAEDAIIEHTLNSGVVGLWLS